MVSVAAFGPGDTNMLKIHSNGMATLKEILLMLNFGETFQEIKKFKIYLFIREHYSRQNEVFSSLKDFFLF